MSDEATTSDLHPVEVLKLEAERRKIEAEAELAELRAEDSRRAYYDDWASPIYYGRFYFDASVNSGSVKMFMESMERFATLNPGADITLILNSPGGSVFDGFALFDKLRSLSARGHRIVTECHGMAASMASILMQAGDRRVMGPESFQMLHEVSTGAIGKASELADTAKLAERLTARAADIYARRGTLSAAEFLERMERRDYWLEATECLELGLVDEIA